MCNRSVSLVRVGGRRRPGTTMSANRSFAATHSEPAAAGHAVPLYLVLDTESIPDGHLLSLVKYPNEELTPLEAVERAREEARRSSLKGSDFVPVAFQYPIAACVL